jgi:glycine betaine/choline ABC-type transport system substrate-binding protein
LRYYGTATVVDVSDDPVAALDDGAVSVTPGFTGRLLERFAPDSTARSAAQVYRAMVGALPEGVAAGDYAVAAEDKAALAVTAATAAAWGSRDLTALVGQCSGLNLGAIADSRHPASVGSCALPIPREFRDAAAMFDALRAGEITAAWTGTADVAVPDGVVVLVDRKPTLVPAQNVVALYRRNELNQMQLRAINELAGVLDTAALVDMLRQVRAGADPRSVAEAWLTANPLGR